MVCGVLSFHTVYNSQIRYQHFVLIGPSGTCDISAIYADEREVLFFFFCSIFEISILNVVFLPLTMRWHNVHIAMAEVSSLHFNTPLQIIVLGILNFNAERQAVKLVRVLETLHYDKSGDKGIYLCACVLWFFSFQQIIILSILLPDDFK